MKNEIPAHERWVHENPEILKSVMKGIKEAKEGRLHDLGSFAKYAQENEKPELHAK